MFEFATHGNGNGLDDLYILPSSAGEALKITRFLRSIDRKHTWELSDVPGQNWYGAEFLAIPFGLGLLADIRRIAKCS